MASPDFWAQLHDQTYVKQGINLIMVSLVATIMSSNRVCTAK